MDPDVFVTIAFAGYAFIVAIGIGVFLRVTSGQARRRSDDDAT